ncbi:Ig-like domain-containing protein [Paenibacillus sp. GCM10027628]|uniref:Ig-like domain-containing protein n=1 Tax=Paenibacillus sp. GCM10027628 TaxID=3273413 RepID=UPI0036414CD0
MQFSKKSFFSLFVCFCMLFSLLSTLLAKPVDAKTVRVAVIASLSGDVTVKKGGGSKTYDAYENMSLNQGDTLYTGADSSVTLNLSNGDSDVTLGDNAELNVSDLNSSNGSKKSKLKIWAGSMWVKVKSLAGTNDEFEVETPTAVMGVRGTQFFVGVDPHTGKIKMAVGAGRVSATTVTADEDSLQTAKITYLYPTQQISLDSRDEVNDPSLKVSFIDLEGFIQDASPEIIKAIIENKAQIDKENDEFIAQKKKELENGGGNAEQTDFTVKDQAALDKVKQNLDNLVGNIAKKAVADNKISKSDMDKLIEKANEKISDPAKKLDLDKVKELDQTAGVDPDKEKKKQEELKKLEAEKVKKQQEEALKLAEIKQKLDSILKAAEEAKKKIEEANKQAAADAQAKAEKALKNAQDSTTTPAPSTGSPGGGDSTKDTTPPVINSVDHVYENQTFISGKTEARAKVTIKRDGAKIAEGAVSDDGNFKVSLLTDVAPLTKGQTLFVTATDAAGNTSEAKTITVESIPIELPSVNLVTLKEPGSDQFSVGINLKDFKGSNEIYAVEVHLLYSGDVRALTTTETSNEVVTSHSDDLSNNVFDISSDTNLAAETAIVHRGTDDTQNELVYAITGFGSAKDIEVVGEKELVRLPFKLGASGSGRITLPTESIIIIKKDLTGVQYQLNASPIIFGTKN